MRFSVATLLVLLPLLSQAAAVSVPNLAARQNGGRQRQGGNRNGGNNAGDAGAGAGTGAGAGAGAGAGGDPQTSLTLDPKVIAKGFANNGQDVPAAGQVESLTSTNNFINFCLTVPDLPITDGKQITTGSCNPAPIGAIPSVDRMPSSKFTFPKNGGNVGADQQFTISMAIKNLQTGNFVNAQSNYFAAPQQLNGQGIIIGHSHVVVEELTALDQTTPTDPKKFAFFKGLNAVAAGGVLTADVTNGLPAGAYRLCSINAASNHQPAIVPVAQHGSLDDCVYFTSGAAAAGGNNGAADGGAAAGAGAADGGAAAGDAAAGDAAAGGAAAGGAAAGGAAGAGGNQTGGGRGGRGGGRNGGRGRRFPGSRN
ncbi:hypothetical protein D9615_006408 [Tricholomella constricta]|uniref:Ribosomal protein s17 n=1 Tax=Tricholomella constricta TaxID=117010 RepID=A0A8H5M1D3_9AGAR|nr:hypothetical protein D9615_006408 [Tricholomella constricta]